MKASLRAPTVRPPLLFALAFAAALAPHAARAQPGPSAAATPVLRWTAPADCPTEAAVNEELATLTGHPETAEGAKSAAATVTSARSGSPGEALDVELRFPGRPPRRFRAATCREAAAATALIVALTFYPEAPTTPEPPPVSREKPPAEKPAQEVPWETPQKAAPSPPRFQLAAFAGATFDGGTLPGPTPGGAVGLALTRPFATAGEFAGRGVARDGGPASTGAPHHLRVAASVATFLNRERATPNGAVASFSLLSVQLRGCWELPFAGRFTAGPCLGGRFAHLSPNLYDGMVERRPGATALFGLGGGAHVAVRLSPVFAVRGEFAIDGWLTHPQFVILAPVTSTGAPVHGVPIASFFGAISVDGRLL